jgi:poly-gamma-glutamate synthesis protein (capsule biosynthesis protein)
MPGPDPKAREFAHALIDRAGVDVIHGHGAHHVREMEVYRDKLILYGCGDFLNDFEGINLYPTMRPDLTVACLADIDAATGRLTKLDLIPIRIRQLRMNVAGPRGTHWLQQTLNRRCADFGVRANLNGRMLSLTWRAGERANKGTPP